VTSLQVAALVAEVASVAVAVALARRRPTHRPAAVALGVLLAANVLRSVVVAALPWPPPPTPIEGGARVLIYFDRALMIAAASVVPGLALWTSVERPRRAVACVVVVWALASIVLAALYPSPIVRGASLARIYLAADLVGLFVAVATLIERVRSKRPPTSSHGVLLALVTSDLAILLVPYSPWREGLFGRYEGAQLMILVLFVVLACYQGVLLWFSRSR
jgi:hypothetical protein